MSKVGVVKTKLLKKLTESYSSKNKSETKDILKSVVKNKDFKEMYLFYEEIENKYIEDKETAKLYVEGVEAMFNGQSKKELFQFCKDMDNKLGNIDAEKNELYESLDILLEKDSLSNIEKKVVAKKKLIEHLLTIKDINKPSNIAYTDNENLLNSILANNFNVLYSNTLSEEQKETFKNIISLTNDEMVVKFNEIKESVNSKITNLLSESKDDDFVQKLNKVRDEISKKEPSRLNYFRLTELKSGLD